MSAPHPISFEWTGEALVPAGVGWQRMADKQFVIGEIYRMEEIRERSGKSHSHYFIELTKAWENLPESQTERFPTAEHLRKFALIKTGYCDQRHIVCASKADARRVSAFIKPMDEYAIAVASENVVTVYTAKSQSFRAMGKDDFQASKDAVLDYVASLVRVTRAMLHENAGRAA